MAKSDDLRFKTSRINVIFEKSLSPQKYFECMKGLVGDLKSNPERFWSFLRRMEGSKSQILPLLDDIREVSNDVERAELLNRTFISKFPDSEVEFYTEAYSTELPQLARSEISETEVSTAIAIDQLKNHRYAGLIRSVRALSRTVPISLCPCLFCSEDLMHRGCFSKMGRGERCVDSQRFS